MKSVDIIIPVYNDSACILDAVSSAIKQEYVLSHVIVVNDGSTDETENVLRKSDFWGHFEYFFKENGGVASARNEGLRHRHSEYCCFLDSDDVLEPNYANRMISFLAIEKCEIAYSDYIFIEEHDCQKQVNITKTKSFKKICLADLLISNYFMTPTVFFDSSILDGLFFNESLKYNEDWLYWLALIDRGGSALYCDSSLVRIRTRAEGLTSHKELRATNYVKAIELIEKIYSSRLPSEYKNACVNYADNLCAFHKWHESLKYYSKAFPSCRFFIMGIPFLLKFLLWSLGLESSIKRFFRRANDRYTSLS